jgi:seryl-tRNA synthetase
LTTCVNLLETDDNFLKSVWKHRTKLDRIYDELAELEETEKKVSRKPEVLKKEGNVYRLNFATPSDGEA